MASYRAIYRQFRPRRFSEITGQKTVVKVLRNQVRTGSPAHAYLFAGQRGTGKTSAARILAMALNCLDPHDGEPCLECENCRDALTDSMIDIIEIDAASNNSVDNARDIREKVNLVPVAGRYKIYIIDEVHMLSNSAFNALLKTLEEPPEYAVFILATTELQKVPRTVLSRCQRFDFKSLTDTEIEGRLEEVAGLMGLTYEEAALREIARAAGGAMRDALSILETCIDDKNSVTLSNVSDSLGLAGKERLKALISALDSFDGGQAISVLREAEDDGAQPGQVVSQLIQSLRDRLFGSYVKGTASDEETKEAIRRLEILQDAETQMRTAVRPSLTAEIAMMKLTLPERGDSYLSEESRILKLERRMDEAEKLMRSGALKAPVKEAQEKEEKPREIRREKPDEDKGALNENAEDLWNTIKNAVRKEDPMLYALIKTVYAEGLAGSVLTLGSTHRALLKGLRSGKEQWDALLSIAASAAGRKLIIDIGDDEEEQGTPDDDDSELPFSDLPLEDDQNYLGQ